MTRRNHLLSTDLLSFNGLGRLFFVWSVRDNFMKYGKFYFTAFYKKNMSFKRLLFHNQISFWEKPLVVSCFFHALWETFNLCHDKWLNSTADNNFNWKLIRLHETVVNNVFFAHTYAHIREKKSSKNPSKRWILREFLEKKILIKLQ